MIGFPTIGTYRSRRVLNDDFQSMNRFRMNGRGLVGKNESELIKYLKGYVNITLYIVSLLYTIS